MHRALTAILCLLAPLAAPCRAQVLPYHDLEVRIEPATHRIEVKDEIRFAGKGCGDLLFSLDAGLTILSSEPPCEAGEEGETGGARLRGYRVRTPAGGWPEAASLRIAYRGEIYHPLTAEEQEYARSFSRTPGIIGEEGVMLGGSSGWIPSLRGKLGAELVSFRLAVDLPAAWDAVSEGRRIRHEVASDRRHVTWDCPHPMDEVHLIAGPFTEYSRPAGAATAYAFLREPDPTLATKYLEATQQYLEMYGKLVGPYPYAKFALVENFWETGYGMPSFTLLGPKIIRFPFILTSSYPHEILHNWWGNSVFVEYERGNWCEGLTAYLADHLLKEGQGQGREYRRDTLERYRSYVREGHDFPLEKFTERHSSATEAVGYGKALMLFHMLRRRLGDEKFVQGLQRFYAGHRFRRASFDDLARSFAQVAGEDLGWFFDQWTRRTGAPSLELALPSPRAGMSIGGADHTALVVVLRQVQEGELYRLSVPIAFQLEGRAEPQIVTLELQEREQRYELDLHGRPLLVAVDPAFDVFRRLDRRETPPTLGQIFGAPRVLIVLPPTGDPLHGAWKDFAAAWSGGKDADVEVKGAGDIDELPADRAVWILGSANPWAKTFGKELERYGAKIDADGLELGTAAVERKDHSFALACTHPGNEGSAIGWIGGDRVDALPGLARKLPHYGKYSFLAFAGAEPTNDAKGQWPVTGSPLMQRLGDAKATLVLPPEEPLARPAPVFDPAMLVESTRHLAAEELEGRGIGSAGLDKAGEWIAQRFAEIGLQPGGDDGTYFQSWYEPGGPKGGPVRLRNVIGVLPGSESAWAGQSVVVGAHYDHLGRGWPDVHAGQEGRIHPGADDNASGVAVLLAVARRLAAEARPKRSIVFAAFSGEEWGLKGSRFYVRAMRRWPITAVHSMINLDTVGRLGGEKLQVLGTGSASEWPHIAMGIGFTTGVQSLSIPKDPAGSDQLAFIEAGVPAVQLFSGAHEDYHRPSDTADKLDGEGMAKVAVFTREALLYLADRAEPLTSTLVPGQAPAAAKPGPARRASLGTMPDMAFPGPGVRVAKVMEGSAAQAAGVQDGDVIVAIDGKTVADLRGFSEILKGHEPGDRVRLHIRRGEADVRLEAKLGER